MTSTPPASLSDLAKRLKEAFELIRMHQELQQEDSEALNHAESNITEVRLILESQRDIKDKLREQKLGMSVDDEPLGFNERLYRKAWNAAIDRIIGLLSEIEKP